MQRRPAARRLLTALIRVVGGWWPASGFAHPRIAACRRAGRHLHLGLLVRGRAAAERRCPLKPNTIQHPEWRAIGDRFSYAWVDLVFRRGAAHKTGGSQLPFDVHTRALPKYARCDTIGQGVARSGLAVGRREWN